MKDKTITASTSYLSIINTSPTLGTFNIFLNTVKNCLLIDDEKPALDLLEDNVRQLPYLNVVAAVGSLQRY